MLTHFFGIQNCKLQKCSLSFSEFQNCKLQKCLLTISEVKNCKLQKMLPHFFGSQKEYVRCFNNVF